LKPVSAKREDLPSSQLERFLIGVKLSFQQSYMIRWPSRFGRRYHAPISLQLEPDNRPSQFLLDQFPQKRSETGIRPIKFRGDCARDIGLRRWSGRSRRFTTGQEMTIGIGDAGEDPTLTTPNCNGVSVRQELEPIEQAEETPPMSGEIRFLNMPVIIETQQEKYSRRLAVSHA
jgi:hypothetical protein